MKFSHYKNYLLGLAILCILTIVVTMVVFILVAFQIVDTSMVYIPIGLVLVVNLLGILSGYIRLKDNPVNIHFVDNENAIFTGSSHKKGDDLLNSRIKFGKFGKWIVKISGKVFLESKSGTRFEALSKKVYMFINHHIIKPIPLDVVKQLAQQN